MYSSGDDYKSVCLCFRSLMVSSEASGNHLTAR